MIKKNNIAASSNYGFKPYKGTNGNTCDHV